MRKLLQTKTSWNEHEQPGTTWNDANRTQKSVTKQGRLIFRLFMTLIDIH